MQILKISKQDSWPFEKRFYQCVSMLPSTLWPNPVTNTSWAYRRAEAGKQK